MFDLGEELTASNLEKKRRDLLEYLQEHAGEKEIFLGASNLRNIDAAGVQFLLSACCRTVSQEEQEIQLFNVNDQVRTILRITGSTHIIHH